MSWVYVDATHVNGVALLDAEPCCVHAGGEPGGNVHVHAAGPDRPFGRASGTDAELTNLSLARVFTATDFDADPVVIDAGASINIENDVPANNGTTLAAKLVVEDGLTGVDRHWRRCDDGGVHDGGACDAG